MTDQSVPQVTFKTGYHKDGVCGPDSFVWSDRTSNEIFNARNVVVFALPGAFTPTCSSNHLPGYNQSAEELRALGVDEIICVSVNDPFVMWTWGQDQHADNVTLLPDGNGEFTRGMDMLVEKCNLGFGERSWRYSMYVENGIIQKMFIEPGIENNCDSDPFTVSDADTMLDYLKNK